MTPPDPMRNDTMSQYRKKPVVVEAVQYFDWMRSADRLPDGVKIIPHRESGADLPMVQTIHGDTIVVHDGDWIVKEPDGVHYYPVQWDIFAETYEPAAPVAGALDRETLRIIDCLTERPNPVTRQALVIRLEKLLSPVAGAQPEAGTIDNDMDWMPEVLEMVREALVWVHGEEDMKGCPPMNYNDAIRSAVHKAAFGKLDEARYPEGSLLHRAKTAEQERDEARATVAAQAEEIARLEKEVRMLAKGEEY